MADVVSARRTVVRIVREWRLALPNEQLEDLELLSGEVIANAVRYAGTTCAVAVRSDGTRVRVEVTDTSPVRPRPREASPDSEGGRGLFLVDALATAWGSADDPAGKVVWFEVGTPTAPGATAPGKQPAPWSTPGTWTITATDGTSASGYLPAWAEDDPTETDVPPDELPQRLALIDHRSLFDGPTMPITAPGRWDDTEDDAVFEPSIHCAPNHPNPGLRVPVANLQVSDGRWIIGLDPGALTEIAGKLRSHADLLDHEVRPALIAALDDWTAHHPQ